VESAAAEKLSSLKIFALRKEVLGYYPFHFDERRGFVII